MISVITRTKDRSFFLPRVFESLVNQSYRPIEWIIVNDAGENIDLHVNNFKNQTDELFSINYIYKEVSTTMEAATNLGLSHAKGKYVNILDDDDTIEANFYKDSIGYLDTQEYPTIKGVISYSQYIYENITDDNKIEFSSIEPNPNRPISLTLPSILSANQFPIHSFVYYRNVLTDTGLYDESLPVLGDWEFNIRFIEKYDIGIIPEVNVNYHRRLGEKYGNTVTTQISQHHKYEALVRNKILRTYNNHPAMAIYMNQSSSINIVTHQFEAIKKLTNNIREQKDEQIKYRDEVISNKNEQIKQRDEVISNKSEQLKQKEEEIKYRDTVISNKNKQIKNMNAELEKLSSVTKSNKTEISNLQNELVGIYTGKSWKITKILRIANRLLK